MTWVLLQSRSPWQRNDAITFFIYLCFSVLGVLLEKSLKGVCTLDPGSLFMQILFFGLLCMCI